MIQLTNRQARQFLLLKQGLLGEHIFIGKQGAFDFVRQKSFHFPDEGLAVFRKIPSGGAKQLYSTGELVIHHKQGARKYYALARDYIPQRILKAPDPIPDESAHLKWRLLRRITAVGLLWNRPSDAWLNIWGMKAKERTQAFEELQEEGAILQIQVEGIKTTLFCNKMGSPFLEQTLHLDTEKMAEKKQFRPRCEFLAPLDCFLWDRNLIRELFGFDYKWEIYTPAAQRKYGFYVLPILYGERFIGRIEAVADRKAGVLTVKNIWFEDDVRRTKKLLTAIEKRAKRFAKFNECILNAENLERYG